MARNLRTHFPGAKYHAYDRGNGGQDIFRDWRDYTVFLEYLAESKAEYGFKLHAYCLMPNHFHLLIEVGKVALSKIMQDLLTRYSKYFNQQKQVYGHVFQGRYSAKLCETEAYFLGLIRYIHLNPVGVFLRERPEQWRWSCRVCGNCHRPPGGYEVGPLLFWQRSRASASSVPGIHGGRDE